MSCNSAIFTSNQTNPTVTVPEDSNAYVRIPFGSVVRRFGPSIRLDGDGILLCKQGYYQCDCGLTVSPVAAGPISAQLFLGNTPIPGAVVTNTAAAAGDAIPLPIPEVLVRLCGCECNETLSVGVNASCTVNNLACVVERE